MYKVIVLSCLAAFASARPQAPGAPSADAQATIISETPLSIDPTNGAYNWAYETSNGIKARETGTPRQATDPETNQPTQILAAEGGYSFKDESGVEYSITYTADENGYVPQGAHLPTPPPIPPEIQRAVDYLRSLPSTESPARRR
ncbi:hypothetical protein GE061_012640 [Apolygus lucorum]|uniref:Uncharacterized protein n=1 Tax=Apolygus lucorum TaxID=248454 RepID=A0A6A4JXS1_APOLU|nr:hypothetical protein GE061_012640 [Apolygus lucorum]